MDWETAAALQRWFCAARWGRLTPRGSVARLPEERVSFADLDLQLPFPREHRRQRHLLAEAVSAEPTIRSVIAGEVNTTWTGCGGHWTSPTVYLWDRLRRP